MKRSRAIALLLAAISLASCNARPPGVYDLSVADAYQRLSADELPDLVYARQCGILIHVTPEGVPGRQVTWRVRSSGEEVVRFTATLTPVGEKQTKVEINIPADPEHVSLGMHVRLATEVVGTDDEGTEAIGFGFEPKEA